MSIFWEGDTIQPITGINGKLKIGIVLSVGDKIVILSNIFNLKR